MPRHPLLLCLVLALGLSNPVPAIGEEATVTAERQEIFPLASIRPGMRGVMHTVISGTTLDQFEIEVIDIIRNYLPKQDVILVRCLGDRMAKSGVAQGMSGSPVFIDGKIVGAMAYTWPWAKEPLAGITPIEAMLADAERPLEGRPSGAEPPTPLRQRPPVPLGSDATALQPIRTPLAIGGFGAEAREAIREAFEPLGFAATTVGGGLVAGAPQGWANLDAPLEPGAALVVDVVRGDMSLSAIGTCTWIHGDKILGFGHPFLSMGETLFPVSIGYVYTVMPSRNISFKLGASIREVGALTQDRQSGIVGVVGLEAPMVPFDVKIRNAVTGREESFHVEITANRQLFQRMMLIALRDMITKSEGTLGTNSKKYRMTVKVKGLELPWTYEDVIAGFDTGFSRILMGLVDRVMIHPTQRAEFEWVKLDVEIENRDRRARIESISASQEDVRPGDEVELLVRMRKLDGGAIIYERVPVVIPDTVPEGGLSISVAGGDMVSADAPSPLDVLDLPTLYDAFYKSTELVAEMPTGQIDLDMGGRLIRSLPLSALPRLIRSNDSTGAQLRPVTTKVRQEVPHIVVGQAALQLNVRR